MSGRAGGTGGYQVLQGWACVGSGSRKQAGPSVCGGDGVEVEAVMRASPSAVRLADM
jgi:hypothetical protein